MGRRKKIPSVVLDYDELNRENKIIYDGLAASYESKSIVELRKEAIVAGVESPTTLGKKLLVKRIVDRTLAPYMYSQPEPNGKIWSSFEDAEGDECIKGFCERVDEKWYVGMVAIFPLLITKHSIREGDFIKGKVAQSNGIKMLIAVTYHESENVERKNFVEMRIGEKRPYNISGTAGELFPGLQVGDRIAIRDMDYHKANKIAESFGCSVRLFLGLPPEVPSNLEKGIFVAEFASSQKEFARAVRLAVERCKRLAELGNDVVFIVTGLGILDDPDIERSIIGLGRCFMGKGGITVIAQMDETKQLFENILTKKM